MNPMRKLQLRSFFKQSRAKLFISLVAGLSVVVVGVTVMQSQASSFFAFINPETGTLSGGAKAVTDSTASGGKYLQFGASQPQPPTPPPTTGKKYYSIVSYPGWVHDSIPPEKIDYTAFTHIFHFGMHPTTTGGVALADMVSSSYPPRAVAAAHKAGKKIVLVIGSEGTGQQFAAAAKPANRAKFISNMIATMQKYGYDGLDIDWEENVPENKTNYIALIKELRAALNKISPRPWLSFDVISGLNPPEMIAPLHPYVDAIDIMSYWSNGRDQYDLYRKAGVPANKLILGLGLHTSYVDTTAAKVQAKIDLVKKEGMLGVEMWQIGDFKTYLTDPRLDPLRRMVSGK